MGEKFTRPAVPTGLRKPFARDRRYTTSAVPPALPANELDPLLLLRQLSDGIPDAICIIDVQWQTVRLNDEFRKIFGIVAAELPSLELDTMLCPAGLSSESAWMQDQLSSGKKITLETRRLRHDGAVMEVSISGSPIHVAGKLAAYSLVYRETSEQKREQALNSALFRIAEKSGSAEDLTQFYSAIHTIVGELMDARNFYIAVCDWPTQVLSFPYFVDQEDDAPAPRPLRRGLTEYVLRTGEPLLCTPEAFDRLVSAGEVELLGAPSLDWMGIPLKSGNQTFGAIVVQSYSENMRYGEREGDSHFRLPEPGRRH